MATSSKTSSNNNDDDDSKRPPQPSSASITTNSHDDQDSILQPPQCPPPPPLPINNNISSSSFSSSPPPPPPPSSSSSSRRIPAILSYTKIKSHGKECWSSLKSRFEKVVREPARRRRRWSSSLRWSSEELSRGRRWNSKNERDSWPADGEEGLFCEGLVGLMRRCGRMGMQDDGLTTTITADDDDDDTDGGKEGRGSDSPVDLTI